MLGSCVSLTFWHPGLLVGGMCHYMLPARPDAGSGRPDGRYGDEAVGMLMDEIASLNVAHTEFQVKLFGGGNMFPKLSAGQFHVGLNNIRMARKLVAQHGFNCMSEHLGGTGHRHVIFDVRSGSVWVKHVEIARVEDRRQAATA